MLTVIVPVPIFPPKVAEIVAVPPSGLLVTSPAPLIPATLGSVTLALGPHTAVPQSLVLQMPRFGMDVVLAHPPEFRLMPEIMDQAREQARRFGADFEVVDDMDAAFKDADIVYAKSWGAMVHTADPAEGAQIIKKYESWITDERRMGLAKPDAIYMHPLPADRNIEVTDGVMDGLQSVVYDEAENRLHVQKAIMFELLKD